MARKKRKASSYDSTESKSSLHRSRSRSRSRSSHTSKNSSSSSSEDGIKEKDRGPIENLVLHYLSALQSYFTKSDTHEKNHPSPGSRQRTEETFKRANSGDSESRAVKNVANKMEPCPDRYSSKNKTILDQNRSKSNTSMDARAMIEKERVYNIVAKAVDYGLHQGVVSKSGNYFWFKWNNRIKHRRKLPSRQGVKRLLRRRRPLSRSRKKKKRKYARRR